jgi:predicted MFS family arabinose efflux permease
LKNSLRLQVPVFTLTRVVLNTMHRMVYPFLAVFARGLGVDLAALGLAVTARSLLGSFGPFLAAVADSRGRKLGMLLGVGLFIAGTGIVVFWPTYPAFVLALVLSMLGKYVFDPSMQAYLGDRVPYQRRGRVLAITEFGWSLSFIIGVPVVGFLIARGGWMAPFPLFAVLGLAAFLVLAWMLPRDPDLAPDRATFWMNLRRVLTFAPALLGLSVNIAMSSANEVVNLVFGVWMEEAFGLQIAALGLASAVIGFSELGGETLSAGLTDRLGKTSAVALGLSLNSFAALLLPVVGKSVPGAFVGLFFFYITFEFSIVSAIPLMTEILPEARATLMAANVASHSMGRGIGALLAASFYTLGKTIPWLTGIQTNVVVAVLLNLLALLALYYLRRRIR